MNDSTGFSKGFGAGRTQPNTMVDTLGPQAETRLKEFTASELFAKTFREGMDMVEETAAYLDGTGRQDSKMLARNEALIYASQSMRLTTRLMQVASWLLVQRALKEGEMTGAEARAEKYRLVPERETDTENAKPLAQHAAILPALLLDLLARSEKLYERIVRLDRSLYGSINAQHGNTVADQISRLEAAFSNFPS
ncbi:MAG: regulator of CtrA degradation rcdA [Robiginitomaculum sp.]|nr:MAG: regulator of CtrA degradation rcdA [Robiginitomaculum sp.]